MRYQGRSYLVWYIVPFIINTGGIDSYHPIVLPATLSRILKRPVDMMTFNQEGAKDKVTVPSLLGNLDGFSSWEAERIATLESEEEVPLDQLAQRWAEELPAASYEARRSGAGIGRA